jgi:hypothetical protein
MRSIYTPYARSTMSVIAETSPALARRMITAEKVAT